MARELGCPADGRKDTGGMVWRRAANREGIDASRQRPVPPAALLVRRPAAATFSASEHEGGQTMTGSPGSADLIHKTLPSNCRRGWTESFARCLKDQRSDEWN